jgi:hypothetical protein
MVFDQLDGTSVEEPGLGGARMGVIAGMVGEAVARVLSLHTRKRWTTGAFVDSG